MGQVVTLMPLLKQTIIYDNNTSFNNVTASSGTIGGATAYPNDLPKKPISQPISPSSGVIGGSQQMPSMGSGSGSGSGSQMPTPTPPSVSPNLGGGFQAPLPISQPDFGESGFGAGGDFTQPSTDEYEVLGYDSIGCPIYGYDESGNPLYGVDMNGNIITDPSVLPCAMRSMESTSGIDFRDKTLRTSILVLGGIVVLAILLK
jgi:hypothetical protein